MDYKDFLVLFPFDLRGAVSNFKRKSMVRQILGKSQKQNHRYAFVT